MTHPDMTRDEIGTHTHMVSNQLMTYAPTDLSGGATWTVPDADMDKLLALAGTFQLDGEITPVQAWYRLKTHPRFNELTKEHLVTLKQSLLNDVKCYG